ncbi:MAG: hypothetical protein ETSY1_25560 [Candidatus Entotheonella factor]|uniref:Uncharacterized protein n=1 Tax=Entotheonella factor TaxID=1429438 RepID=W4LFB2_ENTF1|nr:MAG: hypothetical protein ETSY1_25560 [Candidatus Entotheonella factor]
MGLARRRINQLESSARQHKGYERIVNIFLGVVQN